MSFEFEIPVKAITKDNAIHISKSGKIFRGKKYQEFEKEIKFLVLQELIHHDRPVFKKEDLQVDFIFYFQKKSRADLLNLPKSVADALQGILYENDKQIKKSFLEVRENQKEDKIKISVKRI